jgi:hypothetical protein
VGPRSGRQAGSRLPAGSNAARPGQGVTQGQIEYNYIKWTGFSLSNRLFLSLDSVKKVLFFTLELLIFTLEKKPDLDIPRWRGA